MIDFRSETIYYICIDRFNKSSLPVNIQRSDTIDLSLQDWDKDWGGDIQGIIDQLDYLKEMGISAVWLSPIFELNEHTFDFEGRGKFHGYFPKDFKRINRNLVSEESDINPFSGNSTVIDKLISELHSHEMKLILDIVCNFSDNGERIKTSIFDDGEFITSLDNDERGWYHIYSQNKENWNCKWQQENHLTGGLAQFNENIFEFRKFLIDIFKGWIEKGVDAFAINTTKNMPHWYWQELISELRQLKNDIFIFGDWFKGGIYDELAISLMNNCSLPIIDYSLRSAIIDSLASNHNSGFYLIDDVLKHDGKFKSSTELINFIDNNFFPRFLSISKNTYRLELAINLLLTIRGIPFIYYGDEQYLTAEIEGGKNPFNRPMMEKWDRDSRIFQNIKKISKLRKENLALQKGYLQTRYITDNIFVFSRKFGDNCCIIALNRGPEKTFDVAGIELCDGIYEDVLSGRTFSIEKNRIIHLNLKENDTVILSKYSSLQKEDTVITFQLNGYNTHYGEVVKVIGSCKELGNWNVQNAPSLQYINTNTWVGDVTIGESLGKQIYYKYAIIDYNGSIKYENRMARNRVIPTKGHTIWSNEWF